jgi:hypothetical protein
MEHFIELPYGAPGEGFSVGYLITYLQASNKDFIIQGQRDCSLANHPKPNSLDVWLRRNFTSRQDTKQATNELMHEIIKTGLFEEGWFTCPDSGRKCKGIRLCRGPRSRNSVRRCTISRVANIQPE